MFHVAEITNRLFIASPVLVLSFPSLVNESFSILYGLQYRSAAGLVLKPIFLKMHPFDPNRNLFLIIDCSPVRWTCKKKETNSIDASH